MKWANIWSSLSTKALKYWGHVLDCFNFNSLAKGTTTKINMQMKNWNGNRVKGTRSLISIIRWHEFKLQLANDCVDVIKFGTGGQICRINHNGRCVIVKRILTDPWTKIILEKTLGSSVRRQQKWFSERLLSSNDALLCNLLHLIYQSGDKRWLRNPITKNNDIAL